MEVHPLMSTNLTILAAKLLAATGTGETADTSTLLLQLLPFALIIVVFYFILIRPQRKRDKEEQNMRSNLKVGDSVVTRGGIVGKITNIKDDLLTIETGANAVKIRIQRWAVSSKEEIVSDDK